MDQPLTLNLLAKSIEHALLRADATEADLARHCLQAVELGVAAVAVNSGAAAFCARELAGTPVAICAAVSFPLGQTSTAVKVYETQRAIADGASEVDFGLNLTWVKSGQMGLAAREIEEVVRACEGHATGVVLETCYLSDAEKQAVVEAAMDAGATYVKTSTGFGPVGATMPDVLLMLAVACQQIKVKAAGGIRTLDQALGYLDAGAARIGTSHAAAILHEAREVLPA